MSSRNAVPVGLLAALASVGLSACGSSAKPQAGTPAAVKAVLKSIDDPRKTHIVCLQQEHIPARRVFVDGEPSIQVGVRPTGPTVVFEASPGIAQGKQIDGGAQGAEVIGAALLYPNQASDSLLSKVETCVAKGVRG